MDDDNGMLRGLVWEKESRARKCLDSWWPVGLIKRSLPATAEVDGVLEAEGHAQAEPWHRGRCMRHVCHNAKEEKEMEEDKSKCLCASSFFQLILTGGPIQLLTSAKRLAFTIGVFCQCQFFGAVHSVTFYKMVVFRHGDMTVVVLCILLSCHTTCKLQCTSISKLVSSITSPSLHT